MGFPGGDTGQRLLTRVEECSAEIADLHRGEIALVITHGGVMSFVLPRLAMQPAASVRDRIGTRQRRQPRRARCRCRWLGLQVVGRHAGRWCERLSGPSPPADGLYAAAVPRLADVIAALDHAYDPSWAADWDAVGLVCGDPDAPVERILFAIDPVQATVDEALDAGCRPARHAPSAAAHRRARRPASDPKGRLVHRLIAGGCALVRRPHERRRRDAGVSDALGAAIGLRDLRPLQPDPTETWDKIVVFVPVAVAEPMIDAMAAAGAGSVRRVRPVCLVDHRRGHVPSWPWREPDHRRVAGTVERVAETRVEMVLPRDRRRAVIAALRAAHPYEEPAFDLYRLDRSVESTRGTGRIGRLPEPMRLADLVRHVATVLPATAGGVRATGGT